MNIQLEFCPSRPCFRTSLPFFRVVVPSSPSVFVLVVWLVLLGLFCTFPSRLSCGSLAHAVCHSFFLRLSVVRVVARGLSCTCCRGFPLVNLHFASLSLLLAFLVASAPLVSSSGQRAEAYLVSSRLSSCQSRPGCLYPRGVVAWLVERKSCGPSGVNCSERAAS